MASLGEVPRALFPHLLLFPMIVLYSALLFSDLSLSLSLSLNPINFRPTHCAWQVCSLIQDGEVPFAQQADVLRACVNGCTNVYLAQQHGLRLAAEKKKERIEKEGILSAEAIKAL